MNKDAFLKCLEYTGVDTGTSVIGVYSFSSGLSDACFNQLYSTGSNYFNGLPYDNALPLIYIGEGDQPSGFFSSKSPYCINKTSGNFGILISMNYSGCLNMGNLNQILFSSVSGLNNSGMFIGITPSNRLFLNINNYFSTISKEITPSDFTFFSLENNRFINFGIFNIKDNTFYQKSYDHGASDIKVEKLYFGGGLKYNQNQTGYSGKLNEIYLFSGNLTNNLLNGCINCSYATGYKFNQISIPFTGIKITGSLWSGVNEIQITGYQKIISSQKRIDDSLRNFYYDSGVTGIVQIYESLIPKTELISNEFITSGIEFNFDNQKIYSQTKFDLFFDLGLQSGDVIEVYTCNQFNPNVNLDIINNTFPTSNNYVQLFGNGLAETISGESQFFVDYSTVFDNKILGFDEFDILTYDLTTGNSITASYNNDDCVTGQSTSSQMIDLLNVKGIFAEVNSLENISPFIYDLYLNGKKLISGFDYVITGIYNVGLNTWSNHIYLSGDNALLYNLPDPQEFKLVISQKNYIRNLFQINKDTYNLTGLSGFSEQIWRNGIRQKNGIDYLIKNNCSFYTGNYFDSNYSFEILNSTNLFINNFITFDEPFLNEINLLDGLVSYYNLDESPYAAQIIDFHGNNNLTLFQQDNQAWDAFAGDGIINKSFLARSTTNPNTQFAQITDNSNLFKFSDYGTAEDFTISFWFKYPESANYNTQTLFSWGFWLPTAEFDPKPEFNEQINGIKIQLEYDNPDLFLNFISVTADEFPFYFTIKHQLTPSFNKGEWYHLAITYKNYRLSPATIPKITIYLNNNIIKEEEDYIYGDIAYIPHFIEGAATTRVTRIGAQNYLYDDEFWPAANGENAYTYIDELGIWYKALTSGEVNKLWNNGSGIAYENF